MIYLDLIIYPSFLDIGIYLCRTQSNVNRKKLKLSQDTINDNPVNIIILSTIIRTPKTTETAVWIDNEEKSQLIEENQIIEERQVFEENIWNTQFEYITTAQPEDDLASASSMSTSVSQLSIIPLSDNFYIKKKAAIEKVHGIIKSTAEKTNSDCDTICVNLIQQEHNLHPLKKILPWF